MIPHIFCFYLHSESLSSDSEAPIVNSSADSGHHGHSRRVTGRSVDSSVSSNGDNGHGHSRLISRGSSHGRGSRGRGNHGYGNRGAGNRGGGSRGVGSHGCGNAKRSEPEWKWVEKKKNDCDEEHARSSTSQDESEGPERDISFSGDPPGPIGNTIGVTDPVSCFHLLQSE